MHSGELEILVSAEKIRQRVCELARMIEKDFRHPEMVVIGVLKGSFIFMSDLVRQIERPLACDFLRVSSYDQDRSTGLVRMEFDMTQPIAGKDVLLVEDIVDTGRTLEYLLAHLQSQKPNSLKVCTLLYKNVGSDLRGKIDYLGFEIPNRYVVGYGLDSEGLYRSLPFVAAFKK